MRSFLTSPALPFVTLLALGLPGVAGATSVLQVSDRPRQRCPRVEYPEATPIRLNSAHAIEVINQYISEGSNPASYDESLVKGLLVICGAPEKEKVFAAVLTALGRRDHTQRAQEMYALFHSDPIMRKQVAAKLRSPHPSPAFWTNLEQARQRIRKNQR